MALDKVMKRIDERLARIEAILDEVLAAKAPEDAPAQEPALVEEKQPARKPRRKS